MTGISRPPDAPRFIQELTRLTYNIPEGKSADVDVKVERLTAYLELLRKFQSALAATQGPGGGLTLSAASQKSYRSSLNDLFDLIGLKLRENKRV